MYKLKSFEDIDCKSVLSNNISKFNIEKVIEYLKNRNFIVFASSAPLIIDGVEIEGYAQLYYSDGLYKWTSEDVYMIETNKQGISKDFIEHMN